ncbi:cell division protein PerM, partial [Cellulomonas algicola]
MSAAGPRTGRPPATTTRPGRRTVPGGADRPTFFTSALDGAPRWATGALASLQAAVLSLAALTIPAVAAFVATSADPSNAGVAWPQAVGVGAALWLLGHGVPVAVASTTVTLVPLGVSLLALFTCYASARRSGVATRSAYAAAVGAYAGAAGLVALLVG